MRDLLYIAGLLLLFGFLSMQFPVAAIGPAVPAKECARKPFASFVELAPEAYATFIHAARTSWQIRGSARGRMAAGGLDSEIGLLDDSVPPPRFALLEDAAPATPALPPAEGREYAFLPRTMGEDATAFAVKPWGRRTASGEEAAPAFPMEDMLSTDGISVLKETMK